MPNAKNDKPESDLPTGLAKPAQRALAGAGLVNLEQLAKQRESDVLRLHGMGPKAMDLIRRALSAKGLSFAGSAPAKGSDG